MSTAVAIFAKTIGLSKVKTRLAKGIGKVKAEEFYQLSVSAIEEMIVDLKEQGHITPYWALAEKEALNNNRWKSFETIWTGEGCLGERQYNILNQLLKKHDKVIIIGTDSPQIEGKIILETINRLNEDFKECLIGPATDGGFYLFASSVLISKNTWTSVTYSKDDTLEQLLLALDLSKKPYSFIGEMGDVDEVEDLKSLYEDLSLIDNKRTRSQEKLFRWLKPLVLINH